MFPARRSHGLSRAVVPIARPRTRPVKTVTCSSSTLAEVPQEVYENPPFDPVGLSPTESPPSTPPPVGVRTEATVSRSAGTAAGPPKSSDSIFTPADPAKRLFDTTVPLRSKDIPAFAPRYRFRVPAQIHVAEKKSETTALHRALANKYLKLRGLRRHEERWQNPLRLLQQCTPDATVPRDTTAPSLAVSKRKARLKRVMIRADLIPRPKTWTADNLESYVKLLAMQDPPRAQRRLLYDADKDHNLVVTEILQELFSSPQTRALMSTATFNAAIQFFININRLKNVSQLFTEMESRQLPFNAESYNIMLRGAATSDDLLNFTFLLRLMTERHVMPNLGTWTAFLMTPDLPEDARHQAVHSMQAKGMLQDPAATKEILKYTIAHDFASWLEQGHQPRAFVADMDEKYGPNWMSGSSTARMLHVMGRRGLVSECFELWQTAADRSLRLSTRAMNTLLGHCTRQGKVEQAIQVIDWANRHRIARDEDTYRLLLSLAWRYRLYNLARVSWRYACLDGGVTHQAQQKVLLSAARNTPQNPKNRGELWRREIGKVCLGVRPPTISSSSPLSLSFAASSSITKTGSHIDDAALALAKLHTWTPSGPSRDENNAAVRRLVHEDQTAFVTLQATRSFASLLKEAHKADTEWARDYSWAKPLPWKLAHAVAVPCELKTPLIRKMPAPGPTRANVARVMTTSAQGGKEGKDAVVISRVRV